ncbi:MAG: phage holin family protein [Chloroflexi bacterium]|nr:MAG: phage holin family protein [Chloroflexota bacterium]
MATENKEDALGDLLSQLISQTSALVQREIDLARTEMSQKVAQVSRGARMIAIGGALAYAGFLAILATAVIALVEYASLPWWVATLAVGALTLVIGLFVAMGGSRALQLQHLAPQKTLQMLKEDAEWARERATN